MKNTASRSIVIGLFREQGFLVIKGLLPLDDVREMNEHMDDLIAGRKSIDGALIMKNLGQTSARSTDWLRVHMLHRLSPLHERFLLHPRVLDVLEALIGPDVLALQSMLFFKQPGQPGPGLPPGLAITSRPSLTRCAAPGRP